MTFSYLDGIAYIELRREQMVAEWNARHNAHIGGRMTDHSYNRIAYPNGVYGPWVDCECEDGKCGKCVRGHREIAIAYSGTPSHSARRPHDGA